MDKYLRTRIELITEQDFWSSIRSSRDLAPAIAAGKGGRRAKAYRLLGQYHSSTLAGEAIAYADDVIGKHKNGEPSSKLRDAAGMVLRHEICGWHTQVVKFGKKIDFNADFGRSGQYGFHYLGWLVPVLDMYVLTGQKRHRETLLDVVGQYYDQRADIKRRIPNLHPVYYELGSWAKMRLLLPAYAILAGATSLSVDSREAMLKLLLGFARSLYRLQNGGYRHGNWQIVGCAALFKIGAAFPEFKEAAKWRKRAESILREHARKDFFSDGGHGERCWGYGYMSLNGILQFYRSAILHGLLDRKAVSYWKRFFKKGYRWFAASTTPSGHCLNYGDGGIGKVDGIMKEAVRFFPSLDRGPGMLGVDRSKSNILKGSGYAFMRHGNAPESPFMSINFGKTGGGHTHSDLLDFGMWCFGQPLIDEVGRFGSYDNPLDPMFRSSRAHNQIVLEHMPMDRHNHEAHDVQWHTAPEVDMFSAWHDAYGSVRIHRQIVFVKSGLSPSVPCYWVVNDLIVSDEYTFQATNMLHAPSEFEMVGPGRFRLAGSPSCLVVVGRPGEVRRAQAAIDYGREDFGDCASLFGEERHGLSLSKWRDIGDSRPIQFTTLLVPFSGKRMPGVRLQLLEKCRLDPTQVGLRVISGKRQDTLLFNPTCGSLRYGRRATKAAVSSQVTGRWVDMPCG